MVLKLFQKLKWKIARLRSGITLGITVNLESINIVYKKTIFFFSKRHDETLNKNGLEFFSLWLTS